MARAPLRHARLARHRRKAGGDGAGVSSLNQRPVAVVAVGDLARSPRMLNHARELARTGRPVWLIGLRDRDFDLPDGVRLAPLRSWRKIGAYGLGGAAARMGLTGFQLLTVLLRRRPAAVLVQNPPDRKSTR